MPSIELCSAPRRSKGLKSLLWCSSEIPFPVSVKRISNSLGDEELPTGSSETLTEPSSRLYLIAFDSRLSNTCLSRCLSASTYRSDASGDGRSSEMLRSAARGSTRSRTSPRVRPT